MSKLFVTSAISFFVAVCWAVFLWCMDAIILVAPVMMLSGIVTFVTVAVVMGGDTRDTPAD